LRLTQLEIFGFKSFAQKVTIPFGPGITAIVGPNGCGKSNVVEAIRWVLGEQRAGTFRSHRMEDIIFAGTRNRKPLGMSEVHLVIENTNNILPIEFSEVTLTRRLFRSGESDYLMNKIPCRLLDITNLLMDTGLGQGAYAVMEQGMVDEIVSEKTENRRRILEEAAGITKYKARRRSTWNKLESTQADLTRIEDIIAEVKRQVDYLSRQVGRARRYQKLKEELDQLEVLLGRYRFFAIGETFRPLQEELDKLNHTAEEGYTRFTTREAELERMRLEETEAEKALQSVGIELNRRVEEIHERDRRLVATRERLEAAVTIIERSARERQDYTQQLESSQQQQREAAVALTNSREQLTQIDQHLQAQEDQAAEAEQLYTSGRAELDGQKRDLMDRLRQQSDISSALERMQTEREGLRERMGALEEEMGGLTAERDRALEAECQASDGLQRVATARARVEILQQRGLKAAQAAAASLRHLQEQRGEVRRAIEANQARLHVMEKVRSGYQGYSSGVRSLMLDSPYGELFRGVLGDLVDVDSRYARAVEAALGEALEALVAEGDSNLLDAIQYLVESASGRAGIFSLTAQLPPSPPDVSLAAAPGLIGPLVDFVHPQDDIAPLVARLLHNTFLVDDLATALRLQRTDAHLRLVTPTGDAIDLYGRVAGGQSSAEDASLLGRRQEIKALKSVVAHERARLAGIEIRLRGEERRGAILERRLTILAGRLDDLKEREREQAHRRQNLLQEAERLQTRLSHIEGENARLTAREQEMEDSIRTQSERLEQIEQEGKGLEATIQEREERLQQAELMHREKLDQLGALRVERARVAETVQSLKRDTDRLEHIEKSLHQNIERLGREGEQATRNRQQLTEQGEQIEGDLKGLHDGREEVEEERDRRQQHWAGVNARNRELEENISRLQRELNSQRERRHQLELQITELKNQSNHIQERLQEEQQVDVEAMGAPQEEMDAEASAQRLDQLRQSLQRLGSVHLGVLEEYDEQKERYDFLCQQRDDLLIAAEDLKKILRRIDRTARSIFSETFEQIRQKFKETFVRFFDGGEADLRLEADVDPLEAGIDIIARPRGKRLQSITLLSGGERALTAISLLFAIYLVKPSPFCILDEVDAPLDDANIGRFIRVLKEFARTTQFIMVTHNKISMAAADTLHGVTMPEEGVSQLVSVQVEEDILEEAAG